MDNIEKAFSLGRLKIMKSSPIEMISDRAVIARSGKCAVNDQVHQHHAHERASDDPKNQQWASIINLC
jgi:hypothetical protein